MAEFPVGSHFQPSRLSAFARKLAAAQRIAASDTPSRPLEPLLVAAGDTLAAAQLALVRTVKAHERVTPSAEWILDNYAMVRDALREASDSMPKGYYRLLPTLAEGRYAGLPRVFEFADALVSLTDAAVQPETVDAFLRGAQTREPLTLGELWSFPVFLRVVLARRIADLADATRVASEEGLAANRWADKLDRAAQDDPSKAVHLLGEMARERAPFSEPFVLELATNLRSRHGHQATLAWLEERIRTSGSSTAEIDQRETQRETQRQASIANAVVALRDATATDWTPVVEAVSRIEQTLRSESAGVYGRMSADTRDQYRHRVETLARYGERTEPQVAQAAVDAADRAIMEGQPSPADHVGYWLEGGGAEAFAQSVGYRAPVRLRIIDLSRRHPTAVYLGGIALVTLAGLGAILLLVQGASALALALTMAVALLPLLDFAVTFVNWNVVHLLPPAQLPALDFDAGIPPDAGTIVVVPTLITSPAHAREMAERLEVHALANPDPSLRFALLTDWPDADAATAPGDEATLRAAVLAIRDLNARDSARRVPDRPFPNGDRFFLLHRDRRWNNAQGVWMGWERKRGKLEEFNDLLRDPDAETTYTTIEGDFRGATAGGSVRYVVTLDSDTRTTPDGVRALVATAAHPLNQPRYGAASGRIRVGYGVLQPRVSISPESARRTPFARIFSGRVGLDPYTTSVSDAYQDLFGEGIYTGKGLYDVDAFRQTMGGAVPENTVLSHDLLEGSHARAALVNHIEVFDDYPSRYASFAARQHRWTRGDWQLLPWLMPRVRAADGALRPNPLSMVGRWKLFDNLRRSLTAPALLLALLLAWTVLPGSPFAWTLAALFVMAFPIYAPAVRSVLVRPPDALTSSWLRVVWSDLVLSAQQTGLSVLFLPHQAILSLDAIGRTLGRLVGRRRLLEWTTAQQAEAGSTAIPVSMWLSVAWAAGVLTAVTVADPVAWITSLPFAAAWIAAPWVAERISRPARRQEYVLAPRDEIRLRRVARRTWRFFDETLSEENHWLPPDNLQLQPHRGLARRTSPTNIGLALNAVQAARDLGYLTRTEEVHRVGRMLGTIEGLERFRGHLFNWYSTETAEVMAPRYLSTVDSGNLAGSLLTLKQGLLETPTAAWPGPVLLSGMADTLAEFLSDSGRAQDAGHMALTSLQQLLSAEPPTGLSAWHHRLGAIHRIAALLEPHENVYARALLAEAGRAVAEMETLAPWLAPGAGDLDDDLRARLESVPSLGALEEALRPYADAGPTPLRAGHAAVDALLRQSADLAEHADRIAHAIDFRPLYDADRSLLRIGFDTSMDRMDTSSYDLLASEARLASLLAIGKGDVPPEHWFHLGRPTRTTGVRRALLSWSGTMFEYLMPLLFTRLYGETLLADACYNAVSLQRVYGRAKDLPWGVSESAYGYLDLHLTYQYRAFGVPTLGLKRGLAEDYVVAPYATLLALLVQPERALANLLALDKEGAWGPFGYYDAIDYAPSRGLAPPAQDAKPGSVVQTYMAHHQGMGLLAVTNVLHGNVFQERFHRDPLVRSVEVLLQERVPTIVAKADPAPTALDEPSIEIEPVAASVAHFDAESIAEPVPHVALLSNGRYATLVTAEGTGYSQRDDIALTRWHGNRSDPDGLLLFVRDVESGRYWSAGRRPAVSAPPPDRSDFWVHPNKAESARVDDWIETFVETVVSPEDDAEVRRVTLTNYGDRHRTIELTSYAEVVLQARAADLGHPAFSKLFVETEHLPGTHALLATRRPRDKSDVRRWLVHTVADSHPGKDRGAPATFETDRMQFIGRGRTLDSPAAMDPGAALSGSTGPVLDPIVSLRLAVTLAPKQRATVAFMLGVADSRDEAVRLAQRYDHPDAARRAVELASTYGLVVLSHLGLSSDEALYAQELAGRMVHRDPTQAAPLAVRQRNTRPQSGLWAYGISGDLPILVFRISRVDELDAFRLLLKMHALWRRRGLAADLVVLNDHPPSYADGLQDALTKAVEDSPDRGHLTLPGGVFLRRSDGLPDEDVTLLLSSAAVVMYGCLAPLALVDPAPPADIAPDPAVPARSPLGTARMAAAGFRPAGMAAPDGTGLVRFNGYGGFRPDGAAFVIRQRGTVPADRTPLPWSNVIANRTVGFLATESGEAYTWARNSQQNKLTPWSNDPVTDPAGEALFLRDEDTGVFWSPTPQPAPAPALYETTHGFGYSSWEVDWAGIGACVTAFVPENDPVKVVRVQLTNTSGVARRLSLYRFAALVLGERRGQNAPYVVVECDEPSGALTARNPYNATYGARLAFAAVVGADAPSYCASRVQFVGHSGQMSAPEAVAAGGDLSNSLDTELDPCLAHRVVLSLDPGETRTVTFLFGQAKTREAVAEIVERHAQDGAVEQALAQVQAFWRTTLGTVQISTPVPELDTLVNGWLLYQNLSCRVWGRSAFYQSGGAYGFRDQLQDSLALVYTRPDLTRAQILRNAAHQFEEGDVLHWWHPVTGAGTRTRFSDDLLWLPYAVALAVQTTGDASLLDCQVPFVSARLLEDGEHEAFLFPQPTATRASVYDHCCRAIDRSLAVGAHGLPLMGSGDWNDGMNRVGEGGQGESVWLGFFLVHVLDRFSPLCEQNGDPTRAEAYRAHADELRSALNRAGWDGSWYRRAFYDDGTPLGSAESEECRIDAIAQGWAVISGVAPPDRAAQALDAVDAHLVDPDAGILRLLTPPFDTTEHDPGYIKGYLPGVRENGGQYTHGALWATRAFFEAGRRERGLDLLRMLLPTSHSTSPESAQTYKTEPYAVAADVYSVTPHVGRGGWTWYTGAAGWMWRVAVETLLGLQRRGDELRLTPRVPDSWATFELRYQTDAQGTAYVIRVRRDGPGLASSAETDGRPLAVAGGEVTIPIARDGQEHIVSVRLG